eukprot:NODE_34_length_3523_cov_174.194588_g19_i0.p1 GENE.NODE_34_length_3523_cov_174.194588_g19_i0~~NODE_34_length_3523_cov_174.194588_g19_i0.p1  ORF type:complete len:1044 (-),score=280.45 NODE_34_length_3523_cov_174.194588_g19_i0:327-3458(-)
MADLSQQVQFELVQRVFDKVILPFATAADRELVFVDLCCGNGSSTMALVNGMSDAEVTAAAGKKVDKPRRFKSRTVAVNTSAEAEGNLKETGLFDEVLSCDLNTKHIEETSAIQTVLRDADIVVSTVSLVSLQASVVDSLARSFAAGGGASPEGYFMVNFLNPFNAETANKVKQLLVQHLEFVSSTPLQTRPLTDAEKTAHPGEQSAVLESWLLKRRVNYKDIQADLQKGVLYSTKKYYDSFDAITYYSNIWGGDDLHVGMYESAEDTIRTASGKIVEHMMNKLHLDGSSTILDLGAGYGGSARQLASIKGCKVTCLNISDAENARNEMLNQQQRLSEHISVVQGAFEYIPFPDESFDFVWSGDALVHSGDRLKVIQEIARVLKPGGELIFTDTMQGNTTAPDELRPIMQSLHLETMASPQFYQGCCDKLAMKLLEREDLTPNLAKHYRRVLAELDSRAADLQTMGVTKSFIERQRRASEAWVAGAEAKLLNWSLMHFAKAKPTAPYADGIETESTHVTKLRPVTALVTGASRTHETDRHDLPVSHEQIGGQPVLLHAIHQIYLAGIRKAVVQVGYKGEELMATITACKEEMYPDLEVIFQNLGPRWRGGHAAAIAQAADHFKDEDIFFIAPGDHIYDESLIALLLDEHLEDMDAARMLVENDLSGMVGLPSGSLFVAQRPLHSARHVYQLGRELAAYTGIDAGALLARTELFTNITSALSRRPYSTLADMLQEYAQHGTLVMTSTSGFTWFSIETEDSMAFAEKQIARVGHQVTSADGKPMYLVGLPRKSKVKTSAAGGNWAEFNVAKWRSAVFTTKGYFEKLYEETTLFIQDYIRKLGGTEKVLVVEVGCGTGEALVPLHDSAKYVIGMDINPIFTQFCRDNMPAGRDHKVTFFEGNAQYLHELLHTEKPEWMEGTNKVVMCVGNTIGIIPPAIKADIYREMARVAGPNGIAIIAYWNGDCFGDAVLNFYFKNPQLCGEFTGECIDLATRTLRTPSGYCTHWTTPEEAKQVIAGYGLKLIQCEARANGVLVAFKQRDLSSE